MSTLMRAVGSTGANATLTVTIEEIAVLADLPAVSVPLPAGRWLVTAMIGSKPEAVAPPTAVSRQDVTLSSSGSVTTDHLQSRVYRSLDAAGSVFFVVSAQQWNGTGWDAYATTWANESSSSIALGQVAAATRSPLWGADVHIFGPIDRPAGTLDGYLESAAAAGLNVIRTAMPWSVLCPTSSSFDSTQIAKCDAFMSKCAAVGLQAILELGAHCPVWAQGARQYVPANWSDYSTYVTSCIDRWGSTTVAIETQNEPNSNPPDPYFTLDDIVAACSACKAGIAGSTVTSVKCIGPGIAFADAAYLSSLYAHGIKTAVDAFCCHPYAVRFSPNRNQPPEVPWGDLAGDPNHLVSGLSAMRAVMAANGDSKNVWVTEYGFSTSFTGANKTNSGLDVTEAEQAEWLATAMKQAAAIPYLDAFCIYMLYDNAWAYNGSTYAAPQNNVAGWQQFFGLVDYLNQRTKPAYTSVTNTIAALP
jgi:hypothetical protein